MPPSDDIRPDEASPEEIAGFATCEYCGHPETQHREDDACECFYSGCECTLGKQMRARGAAGLGSPEITEHSALSIALRESFIVTPPLSLVVTAMPGDWVKLCVSRMVDGVAREFAMALGRKRTAAEFADVARNTWTMLKQEALAKERTA